MNLRYQYLTQIVFETSQILPLRSNWEIIGIGDGTNNILNVNFVDGRGSAFAYLVLRLVPKLQLWEFGKVYGGHLTTQQQFGFHWSFQMRCPCGGVSIRRCHRCRCCYCKISHLLFLMAPDEDWQVFKTMAPRGPLSACGLDAIYLASVIGYFGAQNFARGNL